TDASNKARYAGEVIESDPIIRFPPCSRPSSVVQHVLAGANGEPSGWKTACWLERGRGGISAATGRLRDSAPIDAGACDRPPTPHPPAPSRPPAREGEPDASLRLLLLLGRSHQTVRGGAT